ncbi:MAG: hypothetical protein XD78_2084 [Desulfotomaculum sp. 46_296]|nr:MAG: hypothetical protein XD78_2084 [Desulfotomaculum sp. 46_296]HAU32177.1 hypothetical protein [Desulfotomaculum sp.]
MPETYSAAIIGEKISNQCTNVGYPRVQGLKNAVVQEKINELIKQQVYSMIPQEGCEEYQVIAGSSEIKVNEKGILSLTTTVYTYRKHAANGLDVQKSLTVNLATGQVYQLADLFKSESNYRAVLTKIIKDQIRERNIPIITDFNGITGQEDFYLTDDSLVIYFQEIEYTPHYVGIPEFIIPFTQLKGLINEKRPIAVLLS